MNFVFPYIRNFIIPTDKLHHFSIWGRSTTNQSIIYYHMLPIVTQEMANPTEWGMYWDPIEAGRKFPFLQPWHVTSIFVRSIVFKFQSPYFCLDFSGFFDAWFDTDPSIICEIRPFWSNPPLGMLRFPNLWRNHRIPQHPKRAA